MCITGNSPRPLVLKWGAGHFWVAPLHAYCTRVAPKSLRRVGRGDIGFVRRDREHSGGGVCVGSCPKSKLSVCLSAATGRSVGGRGTRIPGATWHPSMHPSRCHGINPCHVSTHPPTATSASQPARCHVSTPARPSRPASQPTWRRVKKAALSAASLKQQLRAVRGSKVPRHQPRSSRCSTYAVQHIVFRSAKSQAPRGIRLSSRSKSYRFC